MRALERVIGILEAVAANGGTATASVVADRLGLSLSTTARLMRDMADEAMLERNGQGYVLGTRLLGIVHTAAPPDSLSDVALPPMRALRDLTQETVSLHVRRFDQRVCIAVAESALPVHRVIPVGFALALHFGVTGEVLMAALDDEELDDYLTGAGLKKREERALRERVAAARSQGLAAAEERWSEGLSGIAAAVVSQRRVVAALSVSGPSGRWNANAMAKYRDAVLATAAEISSHIRPTTRLTD